MSNILLFIQVCSHELCRGKSSQCILDVGGIYLLHGYGHIPYGCVIFTLNLQENLKYIACCLIYFHGSCGESKL